MPRTDKAQKPRPRGGEGAGGAAPQGKAGGGGTSTTQPPAQNSPKPSAFSPKLLQSAVAGLADLRPNWTPSRDNPPAPVPHTSPGVALKTTEQQEAFAIAVTQHEGIGPACRAMGMTSSEVFHWAAQRPEFRKILNSALAANFENQVYKLDDLCNKLLQMPPREMNQCANAYGRVFDYRMRIVGKLLPVIYGDQPGTQVNIQNNTGIVCDEATRARLIQMNEKILKVANDTKQLEE